MRTIPATAHEAQLAIVLGPMADKGSLLDGLLGCEAGRRVREHHADTGGFTDQVFAACAVLGYASAPRIRDLPDHRLYAFEPKAAPRPCAP